MTEKVFGIAPIPTRYGGVLFRSRVEARWALFFDAIGLRFQYEFDGFNIREGAYLPDFWLPGVKMFLEVKGVEPSADERAKCASLSREAEVDVLIAIGAPEERFQLLWFDREGERDGLYVFAHDRFAEAGFWLLGEDHAHNIGPSSGRLPGGPLVDLLMPAYAAARSARFGKGARDRVPATAFPADAYDVAA